jgi:hypothetical protein
MADATDCNVRIHKFDVLCNKKRLAKFEIFTSAKGLLGFDAFMSLPRRGEGPLQFYLVIIEL